jgi:acyl-CoA synthetase (NDP forming)
MLVAEDLDRAIAMAAALTTCKLPRGRRAAVVTVSGGTGALVADALTAAGLELPVLSPTTQAAIRALIPSYGSTQNPVDVTGQATRTAAPLKVMEILHDSGEVDIVVAAMTMATQARAPVDPDGLRALVDRQQIPVLFFSYTVASGFAMRALASAGAITFVSLSDLTTAARGLLRQAAFSAAAQRDRPPTAPLHLPGLAGVMTEYQAKAVLEAAGVAMNPRRLARDPDDLEAAAASVGFPLALKIQSADIPHKTEAGGVRLGIADLHELRVAYTEILARARSWDAAARIDGVLLERMAPAGVEMLVGVTRDDTFGPIITVALGGVSAELLGDASRRAAPVDAADALEMLRELRGFPLLDGYRGARPADIAALAGLIATVSAVAVAAPAIRELELNPVIVHPAGEGCSVADAIIVADP